jgi:hypothetical protein
VSARLGLGDGVFRLFPCQAQLLSSSHLTTVMTTGRGVGKTVSAAHWVLRRVHETAATGLIGSPSYGQTNEVLSYLTELLGGIGIDYKLNRMAPPSWKPRMVDFRNILSIMHPSWPSCRHIHIASTDNFEALRGRSVGWMLLDEAALIHEDAYTKVLLPCLRGYGASHKYYRALVTSPRGGANWVSRLARRVGVLHITAPSWQNFIEWPSAKIDEYRELLSDLAFRQEIGGEILNIGSTAMAYEWRPDAHVGPAPGGEPDEVWVTSDQNVSPMVSLIAHRYGSRWHIAGEAVVPDSADVSDMSALLARPGFGLVGRSITLTGDSSGNARSVHAKRTFYQALTDGLRSASIRVTDRTLRSNPPVFASMEAVNGLIKAGNLTASPACRTLLLDMEQARYNPDLSTDKKHHDPHALDALRYLIHAAIRKPAGSMHMGLGAR